MKPIILIVVLLGGCAKGDGISFALGKRDDGAMSSPPFACRLTVAHSDVGSLRQERAQLDRANELLQFCMAQWETAAALSGR